MALAVVVRDEASHQAAMVTRADLVDQARRQDRAAGLAGPLGDVESGVVFGQVRVAASS
jgi:hypothetical protein